MACAGLVLKGDVDIEQKYKHRRVASLPASSILKNMIQ